MKFKPLALLLFLSPLFGFAQLEIPNGNFETWDVYNTCTLDPEGWDCQNSQMTTHVYPDSMAYEGDLAMRVFPMTFFEAQPGVASVLLPTQSIPPSLDFAVKCYIDEEVELDTVKVMVQFFNTDGEGAWIEVYHNEWFSDTSIPDWQWVSMELDQIEPVMDLCVVSVIAGYGEFFLDGGFNTWISVDGMGFDSVNNVEEHQLSASADIWINHRDRSLQVSFKDERERLNKIDLFDLGGRRVFSGSKLQEVIDLPSGLYLYNLQTNLSEYSGKVYSP